MGYFDLPEGELELQFKEGRKVYWQSVMFCDALREEDVAQSVEEFSTNHKVLAARYNGKEVEIPKKYHWELRSKGEYLGSYATRLEAQNEFRRRRALRREDKTTKIGIIGFVKD